MHVDLFAGAPGSAPRRRSNPASRRGRTTQEEPHVRPRTCRHASTYSNGVPWTPTRRRLAPPIDHASKLHTFRDEDGAHWWSDNTAIFRGAAPAYLRQAYRAAGRSVDEPVQWQPPMLAYARRHLGARLDQPIAAYEATSMLHRGMVPVEVFAAPGRDQEVYVDARYLMYARGRFEGCTFWCIDDACVAVRDERAQEIVGLIQRRPPPSNLQRRRGAP